MDMNNNVLNFFILRLYRKHYINLLPTAIFPLLPTNVATEVAVVDVLTRRTLYQIGGKQKKTNYQH